MFRSKERQIEYLHAWHQENKVRRMKKFVQRYQSDKNFRLLRAQYMRKYNLQSKLTVLQHYGGQCLCCGEKEHEFLAIDHVLGEGKKHRTAIGIQRGSGGVQFYRWLIRNNYPDGFRVLCHNCNMARSMFKHCPHETFVGNVFKQALRAV